MTILEQIIAHKYEEIKISKKRVPQSELHAGLEVSKKNFKSALFGGRSQKTPGLIAEIKKKSPSEGIIRKRFQVEEIAKIYTRYAQAISVVTDEQFFGGRLEYLERAARVSHLPLLRKDFIIDEYQIYETRAAGADAVLLIAAIVPTETLRLFISLAKEYKMPALVEVHSEGEIESALSAGAEIIGINNRDLNTFAVDIDTTIRLARTIPERIVIVSESGFNTRDDVSRVSCMVDAVLIGTSLMRAENIEAKITELRGSKF